MKYNPKKKALMVPLADAEHVHFLMLHTLKKLRQLAELPLTPFEKSGLLNNHDHAAIAVVEMAERLGLDFEVTPHNHNKLDLSDF